MLDVATPLGYTKSINYIPLGPQISDSEYDYVQLYHKS